MTTPTETNVQKFVRLFTKAGFEIDTVDSSITTASQKEIRIANHIVKDNRLNVNVDCFGDFADVIQVTPIP